MDIKDTEQRNDLSVVIPVFNEEENLEALLKELVPHLDKTNLKYEILCVNDKSTDTSLAILQNLKNKYHTLRIINHSINCGESAAEATGFKFANGALILTMDADLQNDPADIPLFLAALTDDTDVLCGIRSKREDSLIKRVSSKIANKFRNLITGDTISDAGCTYRLIRKKALVELLVFNGMHRFLPTILKWQGFKVKEIYINHRPRVAGKSKYGVGNRMWRGILDCMAMRWYKARKVPALRIETAGDAR
jgi:glycosyltransferase involved in cell wall biosynthesis